MQTSKSKALEPLPLHLILEAFKGAIEPKPPELTVLVKPRTETQAETSYYQLPFGEKPVSHDNLFNLKGENPIFLRPNDIERLYGIPISTIYDWIHEQPETHFPAVKLVVKNENKRRMVLVPKELLDEWIIEHSTLMKDKSVKGKKNGLPQTKD